MNKIFSFFMFFNENDLLEIKLNEEQDYVEKFIIIESLQTHNGNSKPKYFDEKRFVNFQNKIEYHLIESLDDYIEKYPELKTPGFYHRHRHMSPKQQKCWEREKFQTNYANLILSNLGVSHEDQIMFGGLDEIVHKDIILNLSKNPHAIYGFDLRLYVYKLNIFAKKIGGQMLTSFGNIKKYFASELRSDSMGHAIIQDSGWHFTGLSKDTSNLRNKYTNFSHSQDSVWSQIDTWDDNTLLNNILSGYIPNFNNSPLDHLHDINAESIEIPGMLHIAPNYARIDHNIKFGFPQYLKDNQNKYKEYIYHH